MPDRRYTDRDARGWRIPQVGTRSRAIYDRMLAGKSPFEIQTEVGGTSQSVGVLIWKIKHPETSNAREYFHRERWCPWCQIRHAGMCERLISGGQSD